MVSLRARLVNLSAQHAAAFPLPLNVHGSCVVRVFCKIITNVSARVSGHDFGVAKASLIECPPKSLDVCRIRAPFILRFKGGAMKGTPFTLSQEDETNPNPEVVNVEIVLCFGSRHPLGDVA